MPQVKMSFPNDFIKNKKETQKKEKKKEKT